VPPTGLPASVASVTPATLVDASAMPERREGDDDVARLLVDAIMSCKLALESYRAELAAGEQRVRARVKDEVKKLLEGMR
jgi:hypothetical protein